MSELPLSDGQVDLWCVVADADPQLIEEYCGLLAPEEFHQQQRLRREEVRRQFLTAPALVRTTLSHYAEIDPRAWTFNHNGYGKPAVAGPVDSPPQFNLSHTRGLVICAVSLRRELGVDAEDAGEHPNFLEIARHYFAPREIAALEAAPVEQQREWFFRLWTLKESLLKAEGKGLSIPLRDVAFTLAADRPPRVALDRIAAGDADAWQFAELSLASCHRVALAVRMPATEELAITLRETLPLRYTGEARLLPRNASRCWTLPNGLS